MAADTLTALKQASQGLTYESETDAPWEVVSWPKAEGDPAKAKVLQRAKHAKSEQVEEMSLDEFFKDLAADQGWHGKAKKETARKHRALLGFVRDRLGGAKVFKVGGEPQKTVYVVGKAKEGGLAGLKATAVETCRIGEQPSQERAAYTRVAPFTELLPRRACGAGAVGSVAATVGGRPSRPPGPAGRLVV